VPSATKQTFLIFAVLNKKGCSTFLFFTRGHQEDEGKFYVFIRQGANKTKKLKNPCCRLFNVLDCVRVVFI